MGFIKDVATVALSSPLSLVGQALSHKKKKPAVPQPSMITSSLTGRPSSMIGSSRGEY